jgi:hypothetical protein
MGAEHGKQRSGNHALVGCPIDIFSLGETEWTLKFDVTSSRRSFTEVGKIKLPCLSSRVNRTAILWVTRSLQVNSRAIREPFDVSRNVSRIVKLITRGHHVSNSLFPPKKLG